MSRTVTQVPDPRPDVVDGRIHGSRCTACGQTSARPVPRCARCRSAVEDAAFGPDGVVWSSTVIRIGVPGRPAPRALAYVDLVDGPRLLAHVSDVDEVLPPGTAVRLTTTSPEGDPLVEVVR